MLTAPNWDESKHPRWPAGTPPSKGGEFASEGGAGPNWEAPKPNWGGKPHPGEATDDAVAKESQHFGKGWWYNTESDLLHGMDPGDLGPHGDHDGWISIGDNAIKVGIDKLAAQAFQVANYGGWSESDDPRSRELAAKFGDAETASSAFDRAFEVLFGVTPQAAMRFNPPLIRIRATKGNLALRGEVKSPRRFVENIVIQDPSITNGLKKVFYSDMDESKYAEMDADTFLTGRWPERGSKHGI